MDFMFLYVLSPIAFTIIAYGIFLYLRVARKEKMLAINKTLTENDADQIKDKKSIGKAHCILGMTGLIGVLLMMLNIWFLLGLGIFVVSCLLSLILIGGSDSINYM